MRAYHLMRQILFRVGSRLGRGACAGASAIVALALWVTLLHCCRWQKPASYRPCQWGLLVTVPLTDIGV